jgi:hypothetical protein
VNPSEEVAAETTGSQLVVPAPNEDQLSVCVSVNSRKDSGIRSNSRRSSIQQQVLFLFCLGLLVFFLNFSLTPQQILLSREDSLQTDSHYGIQEASSLQTEQLSKSKVEIILKPAVSQPACPGIRPPSWTHNQIFFPFHENYLHSLLFFIMGLPL